MADPTMTAAMDPAARNRKLEEHIAKLMADRCHMQTKIETMRYELELGEARDIVNAIHQALQSQPKLEADVYEALHRIRPFSGLCLGDLFGIIDHGRDAHSVRQTDCPDCNWCGCRGRRS
jgi:hypothetical protein